MKICVRYAGVLITSPSTLPADLQIMSINKELAALNPKQSIPLCFLFSCMSGLLRVVATMVLAYPDFLERQQQAPTTRSNKTRYIAAHLLIIAVAAFFSIVGTIYGPVSIAVPVTTGTCLLFNAAAMGLILRMRAFNKAQRTGTYVVFFSVLSLIDVGPDVQDNQNARKLLSQPLAVMWSLLVTALMILAGMGTIALVRESGRWAFIKEHATLILATGTTMSNVGMATASKTFASLEGLACVGAVMYYFLATFLGVLFSIVSSTACEQGVFTPLSSVALICTNMITGIIVWEDYKVIDTWIAYVCTTVLMCCGVYLLADLDIIQMFWARATVELRSENGETSSSPDDGEDVSYVRVSSIENIT